jgi:hypothetical protein
VANFDCTVLFSIRQHNFSLTLPGTREAGWKVKVKVNSLFLFSSGEKAEIIFFSFQAARNFCSKSIKRCLM